ncbi:MAG TPA: hypothetical protein ENH14_03260 [candidate division WOR-3 bacterium]|uniref:Uncharacterized protein n=1 Tax=candidate division WOR-3 bacterium TaxID=2052148 RepID=A0A7V0Q7I4_UNCW3|nr:hypothetical protein [candidate division WOR-3 bacterium]
MMRIFKVRVQLEKKEELPKSIESTAYVSLLVLAVDENQAKQIAKEYFLEEGLGEENLKSLEAEEVEINKGGVLGVFIG